MDFDFFLAGASSPGCASSTNCSTNTLCFKLKYIPGFTGVVSTYTTSFFATCINGNDPYLSSTSCTMVNNSGSISICTGFNSSLINLSGNSGLLSVTAGVAVDLHQVCLNMPPGTQTTISEDVIGDLTVSIDLPNGSSVTDMPNYITETMVRNTLCLALPVEFSFFGARKVDEVAELNWTTASEKNNDYFDVEWSDNGINYYSIGKIDGKENSDSELNYNFTHTKPSNGKNYYRIKQVDLDGKFSVTEVKVLDFSTSENTSSLYLYPNPALDELVIDFRSDKTSEQIISYQIINFSGQIMRQSKWDSNSNRINISSFPSGTYILNVITSLGNVQKKWVKI
jgi:hypothetical protein